MVGAAAFFPAVAVAVVTMPFKWSDVEIEEQLTFRGGYAKGGHLLKSVTEVVPGAGSVCFVHVAKLEEWIMQAATGKSEKAALKRCRLFDDLKENLRRQRQWESPEAPAAVVADELDPMNILDAVADDESKKKRRKNAEYWFNK